MLYEDPVTGALHEIPDSQVSGWGFAEDPYGMGEVVYDGLGNPLGFSFRKAFGTLVKKATPFATSFLGPYGHILKTALPIVRRALSPTTAALRQQALQQLRSGLAEVPAVPVAMPPGAMPVAAGGMAPVARRLPPGWRRPAVPYTGPRARRVYLRCSAWPGPRGLVPANAAQLAPGAPVPAAPGVVVAQAPPAAAPRRAYRRRR